MLYSLYKRRSGSTAGSGMDLSSSNTLQALNAQQQLENAQYNAQVETTQLQAQVATTQVNDALAATNTTVAAQQQVSDAQIAAELQATTGAQSTALAIQKLQSDQAVAQTAIEGEVIDNIAKIKGDILLAQVKNVNSQIQTLMKYSKHFGTDVQKIAPVIALETGQGGAAPGLASANASQAAATSPAAIVTAASGPLSALLTGLFG